MTEFAWEPLYGSSLAVLIAGIAIIAVIAFVTPPTNDPRKRKWLIALRSFAALVLLVAAMRPSLIQTDNEPAPATLVIATDLSLSMTLPDGESGDRWSTQKDTLGELVSGISDLFDTLELSVVGYSDQADVIADASQEQGMESLANALDELAPDGDATDLAAALQGSIDAAGGRPLAGIVLIGDGTQVFRTSGTINNLAGNAQSSAEVLDSLGVPLWTIPTGPASSDAASRDLAVTNLADHFQLFAGNQFNLDFTIEAQGMAGQRVPVTVTWIRADGSEESSRARQVDFPNARSTVPLSISMPTPDPGVYRLKVETPSQNGEWVTSNNSQTAFVEVTDGGGRILVLEGAGRPEQTFLRRALREFPDLELDHVSIRTGPNWPLDLRAALQPGRYDIFILGDVHATALGEKQLQQIADNVAQGAGLVTLGGFQTYGSGGYANSPLAEALPVKMNASFQRGPVRGLMSPAERNARKPAQLTGPITVQLARNHPVVDLGGTDPAQVWSSLPKMTGANRFNGTHVRAGVQVLLQTPTEEPLLVVGGFGKGRVASLAFDESYRWWRFGKADAHRRFWRQLMLWLMSREETSGDRVIAEIDRRRFESDERPAFRARVQRLQTSGDATGNLLTLSASIIDNQGNTTPLESMATGSDVSSLSGAIPTLEPGFYELVVKTNQDSIEEDRVGIPGNPNQPRTVTSHCRPRLPPATFGNDIAARRRVIPARRGR